MARRDPADTTAETTTRAPRRRTTAVLAALVALLLVVGAAAGAWRAGLLDRWLDPAPAADADPATIAPPAGVDEPSLALPGPVATPADGTGAGPATERAAVRRAMTPALGDRRLGRHVLATVATLEGTDAPLLDRDAGGQRAIPASTTKLVTSTAALLALGADHRFETTAVQRGRQVVLVGGGDPYLEAGPLEVDGTAHPYPDRATLADLAARTARALAARPAGAPGSGTGRVRVTFDDSLFTGPAVNPTWEPDYVSSGQVSPTSSLWVDGGRDGDGIGVADPAATAAAAFAAALTREGVRVVGTPQRASADGGAELASVSSAPLGEIVERVLDVSDNDGAEVLLRHVGLAGSAEGSGAVEGEGSIAAGRSAVRSVLGAAGVDLGASTLYDGSGLSRANRLDPQVLVDTFRLAASDGQPDLRPLVTGLPVAGFTGSLTSRLDQGPAAALGRVRAKTGTLTGVSALAGVALDLDGTPLVFVVMADRIAEVDTLDAIAALDRAAASLGACRCG